MKMRRYFPKALCTLWVIALFLCNSACSRIEMAPAPKGERVSLSDFELGWDLDVSQEVYTKTEQSVRAENFVSNLYVLLFGNDGSLVHSRRYLVTTATDLTKDQKLRYDAVLNSYNIRNDENSELSSGIIPEFFNGFSGPVSSLEGELTFFAVANYSTTVDQALDDLADDGTDAEPNLRNLKVSITSGSVDRNYFAMVAEKTGIQLNPTEESGKVVVERVGTNLQLRRLDAKISFNISIDIQGASNVSFINPTYKVHRIPSVSYLIERSKTDDKNNTWDAAQDTATEFSCMDNDNFEYFDEFDGKSGFFAFYMRENRPLPQTQITQEARNDENVKGKNYQNLYVMREAWAYDPDKADPSNGKTPVHERDFTYAPENSTFVEISGNLSYTRTGSDNKEEIVSGDVSYIVHLGETGSSADINNVACVNNYDVRRNVRYIYNMRITGINSFELEVGPEGKEKRPGAEGDLSISNSQQISMDAHYGRFLLELDKDSILGLGEDGVTEGAGWNVSSPLGKTVYENGTISSPYDYKWILFAINREFYPNSPDIEGKMVKFPGVQAYDGGIDMFDANGVKKDEADIKKEIDNDYGNNLYGNRTFRDYLDTPAGQSNYYCQYKDAIDEDACLRDINQLLKHLYQEANDNNSKLFTERQDGTYKVTITAFCDEYTYLYNPSTTNYLHPGTSVNDQEALLLWKEYVNTDDRVMNITPMVATDYSQDGNTSITHSFVSISQTSIKTIYNENASGLTTAWGLETTNETGALTYRLTHDLNRGNESGLNSTSNGRTNFLNFWLKKDNNDYAEGDINWTDVMTVTQSIENAEGLTGGYRDAFHACITRNRDLNGNDKIDENEIYWYLAARDQLSGLYIGQPALDDNSWMYTGDGSTINHLISSTLYGTDYTYDRRNESGSILESNIPNFWILWSEEGASWGQLHGGGDQNTTVYDYRCVRNLGIPIDSHEAPQHYATMTDQNGYYTIDVSVVNSRALRSTSDEGENLPFDHERSQNNRPYKSFDVRDGFTGATTWARMRDDINNNDNPCPDGWRVPNQREMLIMMSMNGQQGFDLSHDAYHNNYNLGIATSFSFNGTGIYDDTRVGFIYNNPNLMLLNDNGASNVRIRCVRDHTTN